MKQVKVFTMLVMAFLLLFSSYINSAQAAPVGSPASLLEKGQWDFSIEGGYLSERPMKSSDRSDYEVNIGHGYHSRSYGLTDRLVVIGKIGGSYSYLYDKGTAGTETKTSLSGGLEMGIQLKGIIFENEDSGLEWDGSGQFLYMQSHHKRSGKANADWYEWQIASCLAKKFGRFKPYAGVKFSTVDLDHDDGKGNQTSYEEDGSIGPFIGTDFYFGRDRDLTINLEGTFLIGTEVFVGARYKF
ncbi:MAG: hypothetical protein HQ595_04250 [Candidatus Omnitrophica bacterium]|nr:hypothetical protein [Candidatus Omnitrophota bacterium]